MISSRASLSIRLRTRSPVPSGEASSITRTSASGVDLIFWGGGQDRDQELVFRDAARHKVAAIRSAIDDGAVVLAVCGGYQLLGEYYVTADGKKLPGLGLVDLHTVPGARRNIGNIVIETSGLGLTPPTLVGFENHSGKT